MDTQTLESLGFVYLTGGLVQLGTPKPLPCRLEGQRLNETPVRQALVDPFWICKYCVTNEEYERFDKRHRRPLTSPKGNHPVTEITYLNAIMYAEWLVGQLGFSFNLPTEAQWTLAAAPSGFEYPWGMERSRAKAHVFKPGVEGPLEVNDDSLGVNYCGLFHVGGNVQEYILGTAYAAGTNGAATDGMYCIVKGGDWSHCPYSPGVHRRALVDVSAKAPTVGFRLIVNFTTESRRLT